VVLATVALGCLIAIVWSMFLVRRARRFDGDRSACTSEARSMARARAPRWHGRRRSRREHTETPW